MTLLCHLNNTHPAFDDFAIQRLRAKVRLQRLWSKQVRQLGQFLRVQIRNEAVVQAVSFTIDDEIPATILHAELSAAAADRWPDEDIDKMLVVTINQRSDSPPVEIVQTPACE